MPVMDGFQLTTKLREYSSIIPIVAVTAYASEEDRSNIKNGGFSAFIAKPINGILLKEKIVELLG